MSGMKSKIHVVAAVFSRWYVGQFELALFQRKVGDLGAGLWEFPGGKVEFGESEPQALMREIDEELGLQIKVRDLLGRGSHEYPERVIHLSAYWVSTPDFNWILHDHDAVVWVREDTWRELVVAPVDVALLELAFQVKRPA